MKNELQKHQTADRVKWIATGVSLLLVLVLLVGLCLQVFGTGKVKPSEWFAQSENVAVEDRANAEVLAANNVRGISLMSSPRLMSAPLKAAAQSNEGVTQTVTAKIIPENAANKAVDWQLVWADDNSAVTDCVTLNVPSDGALTVTITCMSSFAGRDMKLICTSRASGVTATATITCKGIPSSMTVNGGTTITQNWNQSASYDIALSNVFGYVGDSFYNDLTVKSVKVNGTIQHYSYVWVSDVGASSIGSSYDTYGAESSTITLAEKYPDAVNATVANRKLNISVMAYPATSWRSASNGSARPNPNVPGYGCTFYDVYFAPENVSVEIVVGTGSLTQKITVNLVATVEGVSLNSNTYTF